MFGPAGVGVEGEVGAPVLAGAVEVAERERLFYELCR